MKKSRRNWLLIASGVTSLSLLVAGCASGGSGGDRSSSAADGVSDDSVTIGMLSDLTGPSTANVAPYLNGAVSYFTKVNADGGIDGRKINLVVEDDKTDAAAGTAAYRKFLTQTPAISIMGSTSAIQAAIADQLRTNDLPLVAPPVVTPSVLSPFDANFYSLACTYADEADVAVAYMIKDTGVAHPKAYVVSSPVASGTDWLNFITARVQKAGGTIVGSQTIAYDALDADTLAQDVASKHPDVLFLHGNTGIAQVMMRSLQKFGVTKLPIAGISFMADPSILAAGPDVSNDYNAFDCYTPPAAGGAAGQQIIKDAQAAGFKPADYTTSTFTQGYIAAEVVATAIKNAGDAPTRDKFKAALDALSSFDTGGLSPTISFSSTNHVGVLGVQPFKWNASTKSFDPVGKASDYAACVTNFYVTNSIDKWSPDCIK